MKSIKTLAAIAFAALTLSLTGCSKDPEDLIIGTWEETEVTYTETYNGNTETNSMLEEGETAEITFNKDLTFSSIYHSNVGDATSNGTYSIAGDKITITTVMEEDTDVEVYNIDNIDKKNMTLSISESMTYEGETYSYSIKIVCKKK
jgi:hypothetical protein